MELCVNGEITDQPSADDIVRALDATPHPEDWFLVLESGASLIEVGAEADGRFSLSATDKGRSLAARTPIDAARLKKVLLKFRAHDRTWRDAGFWTVAASAAPRPSSASSESPPPPAWAGAIIVGVIGIAVLAAVTHRQWRHQFPFADSTWFWIGLIAAPFVTMVAVALVVKLGEVRRAAAWATTTARIVRSGTEASRSSGAGRATSVSTVPAIEYEFTAGGRTWRGNRIALREDIGGANTAATVGRYPVGAVVSVHYDPNDPANCVLERELPKGMGKGLASLVAIVAMLAAGGYWLATGAPAVVASLLPESRADPGFVVFAVCFGLAVLLFFRASLRSSRQAAGWPVARGTVTESAVESVEETDDGTTRTTWVPAVEYRYRVGGVEYFSRQIKLGVAVSAGKGYAEKVAARYPRGSTVDVHYDPANPSSAALENPTRLHWLLLGIALACFALAAWAGGLI
jgi:hypothetical protein